jgi:hypothetical protein
MMSRSPLIPPGAVILHSYEELAAEVKAFFGGHYDELIIVGPPGIGKSEAFRKWCLEHPDRAHYLEGNTKPLATYIECYMHRHKLLVLDDAEGLLASENGRHLTRQLTQHAVMKYLQWLSTVKDLARNKVPTSFQTASKCAFLMNRFVASRQDGFFEAVLDRGHVFYFDPPVLARHMYVATWFHDQGIHDFVGANLHRVDNLTARTYNLLYQKKSAGHDWQAYFFDRFCHENVLQVVQQLENSASFKTVDECVEEFIRRGLGCRRSYFNYKEELAANGQLTIKPVKPIPVQGTAPQPFDQRGHLRAPAIGTTAVANRNHRGRDKARGGDAAGRNDAGSKGQEDHSRFLLNGNEPKLKELAHG